MRRESGVDRRSSLFTAAQPPSRKRSADTQPCRILLLAFNAQLISAPLGNSFLSPQESPVSRIAAEMRACKGRTASDKAGKANTKDEDQALVKNFAVDNETS